jgi:hypothetical protein
MAESWVGHESLPHSDSNPRSTVSVASDILLLAAFRLAECSSTFTRFFHIAELHLADIW